MATGIVTDDFQELINNYSKPEVDMLLYRFSLFFSSFIDMRENEGIDDDTFLSFENVFLGHVDFEDLLKSFTTDLTDVLNDPNSGKNPLVLMTKKNDNWQKYMDSNHTFDQRKIPKSIINIKENNDGCDDVDKFSWDAGKSFTDQMAEAAQTEYDDIGGYMMNSDKTTEASFDTYLKQLGSTPGKFNVNYMNMHRLVVLMNRMLNFFLTYTNNAFLFSKKKYLTMTDGLIHKVDANKADDTMIDASGLFFFTYMHIMTLLSTDGGKEVVPVKITREDWALACGLLSPAQASGFTAAEVKAVKARREMMKDVGKNLNVRVLGLDEEEDAVEEDKEDEDKEDEDKEDDDKQDEDKEDEDKEDEDKEDEDKEEEENDDDKDPGYDDSEKDDGSGGSSNSNASDSDDDAPNWDEDSEDEDEPAHKKKKKK